MTGKNRFRVRTAATALLLAAIPLQGAAAQAQAGCLSAGEVRALTTFAMPSALTGLIDNCTTQVGAKSFMATQGRGLVAAYAARKDAAWPQAKQAFFRIADNGKANDKEMTATIAKMPDAALQPFVEGMIGSMIGSKLKPGQCVIADKIMRLLAPLPPENTSELLGTIIELTDADRKAGPAGLTLCK